MMMPSLSMTLGLCVYLNIITHNIHNIYRVSYIKII
jgi:hypothetical protein